MWTPKRVILLFLGLLFFVGGYQIYALFLGKYDGLPPLPEQHRLVIPAGEEIPISTDPYKSLAAQKLLQAFGPLCKEVNRRIQLRWEKEGVVIAAEEWGIVDGQLHLQEVSIAFFSKKTRSKDHPEIHTIKGDRALIQFDRPFTRLNPYEAKSRKPIAGRIESDDDLGILLQSNRGTPKPEDDIRIQTKWIAYDDQKHLVWSDAPIRLTERDPIEALVTGKKLRVILDADEALPTDQSRKLKGRVTGVKQVRLEEDVRMIKYVDAGTGFLGAHDVQPAHPANTSGTQAPSRSQLTISSQGPFIYDFEFFDPFNDRAKFTDKVEVLRSHVITVPGNPSSEKTLYDELRCDKLTLQFQRNEEKDIPLKDSASTDSSKGASGKAMLVAAYATGTEVVLHSEVDHLHAVGTEMHYETVADKHYRTTLRGSPNTQAQKDGNQIVAQGELVLETKGKQVEAAHVHGPGEIKMRGDKNRAGTARWEKELRLSKDGILDHLVLTGNASFEDTESRRLQADQLSVWLEPAAATPGADNADNRRPHRIHALGNVAAHTPEIVIDRSNRVTMEFVTEEIPSILGEAKSPDAPPPQPKGSQTPNFSNDSKSAGGGEKPTPQTKPPIHLNGAVINVHLVRRQEKPDLKSVWAQGQVHVFQQEPNREGKSLEVKSETLSLTHSPLGDVLEVFGDPAQIQHDDLFIVGSEITLDQQANIASAKGIGSLKKSVSSDLEGNKLKEPSDLIVHWKEQMFFDGTNGVFEGGVQAEQENARLSCRNMQLLLEQPISFKDRTAFVPSQDAAQTRNDKQPSSPPSLSTLICDLDVRFEKGTMEGGAWKEFQRIETQHQLAFYKPESELVVHGPGVVRLLQMGPKDFGPKSVASPHPKAEKSDQKIMKLTRVAFDGKMIGYQKTQAVKFFGGVRLIHLPSNDPDLEIQEGKLPADALEITGDELYVRTRKILEEETREFGAKGNVRVQSQRYHAQADIVTYDEIKDMLTFEGEGNNWAILYQQKTHGGPFERLDAKKIIYWPKIGEVRYDRARSIDAAP